MLEAHVKTERKGSNPGGVTQLFHRGTPIDVYLKYCNISNLGPENVFNPSHQPIYEAITLAKAQQLGLEVPNFYLLYNKAQSINFTHDSSIPTRKRINDRKLFYLVSQLVEDINYQEDIGILKGKMISEKLYRDLLLIGDASNRKQNYALITGDGDPYVLYIDLGCSFVDSNKGILSQRNSIKKLIVGRKSNNKTNLRREKTKAYKFIGKYGIITNHRDESLKDIISLTDFVEDIGDFHIPTFPYNHEKVKFMITPEEIEEIRNLLLFNIEKTLRSYLKKGYYSDLIVEL